MWSKQALHDLVESRLRNYRFIVVANREPYIHRWNGKEIECVQPASGMATALDPVMRACDGVWVAHGSGDADREVVDEFDHVRVPPEQPAYTLRRVWLSREEEDGYYYGMANSGLWPLCHIAFTRPVFEPHDWETYRAVNAKFADAVLQEAGEEQTFVFVQDYHFALLPRMLKEANPRLIIAQFWHIPWPSRETMGVFPWTKELLQGMLGNDLLGFHLRSHCQNFLDTVDRSLESRVDMERFEITVGGKSTLVRPFPIGIDFEKHQELLHSPRTAMAVRRWQEDLQLDGELLGIGIDRLDYTKGIPERLRGLDRLFELHPEYRRKLRFVQIAVPSRTEVDEYQWLSQQVEHLTAQINRRWGRGSWQPVTLLKRHYGQHAMMALHLLSNFCVVSSLHDGLNLVAKEYVASRHDLDGVLILSRFTGASRELTDALLINPFSVEEVADAMHQALTMPEAERRRRMQKLRAAVEENNVYRWAGKVISALLKFDFPEV
jgi:trehalose 6-phosphate synthase